MTDGVMYRVLLVEDDALARDTVRDFLEHHGHDVMALADGHGLLESLKTFRPDAIVLDLLLPGDDGVTLARKVREVADTPLIMLTGHDGTEPHLASLESGADAFLAKGVDLAVVEATVRRLVERLGKGAGSRDGDREGWTLDAESWVLSVGEGAATKLTAGEFYLLSALASNAPEVVSRAEILEAQGKPDTLANRRNLDVYVRRLKSKVASTTGLQLPIKAVYAAGFAFTERLDQIV